MAIAIESYVDAISALNNQQISNCLLNYTNIPNTTPFLN